MRPVSLPAAILALMMILGIGPSPSCAQVPSNPRIRTERAIEELQLSAAQYPTFRVGIDQLIQHLAQSLRVPGGGTVFLDPCHLQPPPAGARLFLEGDAAFGVAQRLLDGFWGPPPPSLAELLRSLRVDLLEGYGYIADISIQDLKSLRRPGYVGRAAAAERKYLQALDQIRTAAFQRALDSLQTAWRIASDNAHPGRTIGEPPRICILSPADGSVVPGSPITVSGMVHDLVSGSVNAAEVTVFVNGVPASVTSGSYLATGVPLRAGLNAIVAAAIDRDGNSTTACSSVRLDSSSQARLLVVSGDGQTGQIATHLPEPLVVRLVDSRQQPAAGENVVFRVVAGNGTLTGGRRSAVAVTDSAGIASIGFDLGTRAGVGTNRVRAAAVRFGGEGMFHAVATNDAPAMIHVVRGDNQRGLVSQPVASPLVAIVFDSGQNPVAGVPVTFMVEEGDGTVAGGTSATVATDASGRAAVAWTLGLAKGFDNNRVVASFPGLTAEAARFTASAFVPSDGLDTTISGVVLDNQSVAVPKATIRLLGSALETRSNDGGRFVLGKVPAGHGLLVVDGSTTSRAGTWPALEFEIDVLPRLDNTLEKPVYLLPLDLANGRLAGGPEDVTITVPEFPGFSMTVLADSATFPGGGRTGLVSVTAVHSDKIPMAPGSGMQPRFIVTVQPAGAHFDPPAPVTFPNSDALSPGSVTDMFSFVRDVGGGVSVGPGAGGGAGGGGRWDPGLGIIKAGWHCAAPPGASGRCARLTAEIKSGEASSCPGATHKVLFVEPGQMVPVEACAGPPQDTSYEWFLEDPAMGAVSPSFGTVTSQPFITLLTVLDYGITDLVLRVSSGTTAEYVEDRITICALGVRFDGQRAEDFTDWLVPSPLLNPGREVGVEIRTGPLQDVEWTFESIDPAVSGMVVPNSGTEKVFVASLDASAVRRSFTSGSLTENDPMAYRLTVTLASGGSCCYVIRQDRKSVLRQEYQDSRDFLGLRLEVPERTNIGPHTVEDPLSRFNWGNYQPSPPTILEGLIINGRMEAIVRTTRNGFPDTSISSGYRNPRRNQNIPGSARDSVHQTGDAVDMVPTNNTPSNMYLVYRAALRSEAQLVLLEIGGSALMPGNHEPGGATLGEVTDMTLTGINLRNRELGPGVVAFQVTLGGTIPFAGQTVLAQGAVRETVRQVERVPMTSPPVWKLIFSAPSMLQEGTTVTTVLTTPYRYLFGEADHVHGQ